MTRPLPPCTLWKPPGSATTMSASSRITRTRVTRLLASTPRMSARPAQAPPRVPSSAAGLGLLAGIGSLAIPGVGPVVAAGWLIATLTGAGVGAVVGGGAGGLVGSLTHAGVPEDDAHVYAEGVRRGGSLVTVRVDEDRAAEAERILDSRTFIDPVARRAEYQQTGWKQFDETAPAVTTTTAQTPDALRKAVETRQTCGARHLDARHGHHGSASFFIKTVVLA